MTSVKIALQNRLRESVCKCGHLFFDHHLMGARDGFYVAAECEKYGVNRWGGKIPAGHWVESDGREAYLSEIVFFQGMKMCTGWEPHCRRFEPRSLLDRALFKMYRWWYRE